jgi:hypothetical protein
MAFSTTDFDDVDFADGTGWVAVFEIHRGIKERAAAVGHGLADTLYSADFSGTIWTQEDPGSGRQSLPTLLSGFYSAVVALVGSDANIKWSETSGSSTFWTISTLKADIAMGVYTDKETAWDNRAENSGYIFPYLSADSAAVGWQNWLRPENSGPPLFIDFNQGDASVRSLCSGIVFPMADITGTIVSAEYGFTTQWDNSPAITDMTVLVGATSVVFSSAGSGTEVTTDPTIGSDLEIDLSIDTAEPSTHPFGAVYTDFLESIALSLDYLYLYLDIAGELTDQA